MPMSPFPNHRFRRTSLGSPEDLAKQIRDQLRDMKMESAAWTANPPLKTSTCGEVSSQREREREIQRDTERYRAFILSGSKVPKTILAVHLPLCLTRTVELPNTNSPHATSNISDL